MSRFSYILKSLREEKGLNQTEIAKLLGLTRSRYANYELGLREPDLDTLELLSDFFNVDTDYLLGITNKTTKYTRAHDEITVGKSENEELLEELHKNPNLKILLHEGKNVSEDTLKLIIDMVKKMKD